MRINVLKRQGEKYEEILIATYDDIHILGIVCLWLEGSRLSSRKTNGGGSVGEVEVADGGCWWLAERRTQWCRPMVRWSQPWHSNSL
ncbi:hypothetical protein M0804_003382 [Polistes exclamans]|nr:hypothetical protein M0804_003382 [Polistes exclamans]